MDNLYIIIAGSSSPQSFTVEVLNSTAVELSWQYPESPNGEIRGYRILYAEFPFIEETLFSITLDTINDPSNQTAVVTGLIPFTHYSFRVRAYSFGDQNERPNFTHIGVATEEIIVRTYEDGKVVSLIYQYVICNHFKQFLEPLQTLQLKPLPQPGCSCHGMYQMSPMGFCYITL